MPTDSLKEHNILGFTKDNNILLIESENTLYFYNIRNEAFSNIDILVNESDTIHYLNYFLIIIKNTSDINTLEIYNIDNNILLNSISSKKSFDNILDISPNVQYILLQQKDKYTLWNIKENLIQEYIDNDTELFKAKFSNDSSYCILLRDDYISILNTKTNSCYDILNELEFLRVKEIDISMYHNNNEDYLVVAGIFIIDSKKNNLLIFNLTTNMIVSSSTISPSGRVPTVKNIATITDKYIVLLAMYGFMDNNYKLFYADINTGQYITHEVPVIAFNTYKTYPSYNKRFVLMFCNNHHDKNNNSIEIMDIHNKKIIKAFDNSLQVLNLK